VDNPKREYIGFKCTEDDKRLFGAMPDGAGFLRRCVRNRYNDDKGAIEQRIRVLEEQREKIDQEIESLQSHLEDFLEPKDERVTAVVKRFFELGMHKCDTFTQKGWLLGPAQLGNDDVAFQQAWDMITGKNDEGGGWGGD